MQPATSAASSSTAVIDFASTASLDSAFAGANTLMLVSGSEVGQRTQQHANAIAAAACSGITRIVYTSAPHADTSALILAPEHKATE
ncbi:MAG: KR domain-containing protein, partial [Mycobacteriaceae bacterium]